MNVSLDGSWHAPEHAGLKTVGFGSWYVRAFSSSKPLRDAKDTAACLLSTRLGKHIISEGRGKVVMRAKYNAER